MAATIRRLVSRPVRLKQDQARQVRQALEPFREALPELVDRLLVQVDRQTAAATNGWTFLMLHTTQNSAIVDWISLHSSRTVTAMRLWAKAIDHLHLDTGEILLTRDEMAKLLKIRPDDVSTIMGELEGIGAIIRCRKRVAGMRGPGIVRYFVNPMVGTHLGGEARDRAQHEAPPAPLRLMDGGKAD